MTSVFWTDNPTCMQENVRIALCLIASNSWVFHSVNYKTAFRQGRPIDRNIYLCPIRKCKTNKIWKLKKRLK